MRTDLRVIYYDEELEIEMTFENGVALAKWLVVPVPTVYSVLNHNWKEPGWDVRWLENPD